MGWFIKSCSIKVKKKCFEKWRWSSRKLKTWYMWNNTTVNTFPKKDFLYFDLSSRYGHGACRGQSDREMVKSPFWKLFKHDIPIHILKAYKKLYTEMNLVFVSSPLVDNLVSRSVCDSGLKSQLLALDTTLYDSFQNEIQLDITILWIIIFNSRLIPAF